MHHNFSPMTNSSIYLFLNLKYQILNLSIRVTTIVFVRIFLLSCFFYHTQHAHNLFRHFLTSHKVMQYPINLISSQYSSFNIFSISNQLWTLIHYTSNRYFDTEFQRPLKPNRSFNTTYFLSLQSNLS